MARKEHILARVIELQEEQLALHQQATVEAAAARRRALWPPSLYGSLTTAS
jgi:hypothetical protein